MKKRKHFLQTTPIQDWKIAKECEEIFTGTIVRSERWEKIVAKNQPLSILATPITKSFIQNLN